MRNPEVKILRHWTPQQEAYVRLRPVRNLVFTNGCFDILHAGHVELLYEARRLGDMLVVGVNSDESVARLKPGRPIIGLEDRMLLLAALEPVDFVVPFEEDTPLQLIRQVCPNTLVKGADWVGHVVGSDFVNENGGRVVMLPLHEGVSTSDIITRCQACGR